MNFIIPMAGLGSRFLKAGYTLPKMLLQAKGKTLLEWSLSSLPLELSTVVVFIGLAEHEKEFDLSNTIKQLYPELNCRFIFLKQVSRGQAETVYQSLGECDMEKPLVIFNIDTYFHSPTLAQTLLSADHDGVLSCFDSREDRFSFAALDEDERYVIEVREKEVISNHALTGLYTFQKANDFKETYEYHQAHDLRVKGEFYIAPMYNYLINLGRRYVLDHVEKHFILGTPEEYEQFLNLDNSAI
jgi:NDP-sugar pyrophosphorylase family protein